MTNWYWTRERFASNGLSFLQEAVGLTRIDTYFDHSFRIQRFRGRFYYCDLASREEREATISYDVPEEEIHFVRDPMLLLYSIADEIMARKRDYNDFGLDPDPVIVELLESRNCTEIRYFGYQDAYEFRDINGDYRGPVQTRMLESRIDYLAPLTAKYPSDCLGCKFLDKNPYLPCAINPMYVSWNDESEYCSSFEPK